MSDQNASNGDHLAKDPFAPEVVESTIAEALRQNTPATPSAVLVRSLADAYTPSPATEAVLARSRATFARHAEALSDGTLQTAGEQAVSTNSGPAAVKLRPRPSRPPRLGVSSLAPAWRTAAAVFLVALLGAGFFALLHEIPRPAGRPTPTATRITAPSPTVPAYLLPSAPLLPAGWTWYRNDIGHFQVPVAPGWGVGTFYGAFNGALTCEYRVQFFPPGSAVAPSQASATFAPRLIEIDVNLSCPSSSWSNPPDQYTVQEPNPVIVDGQPVTVWDIDTPGEINDFADATFHGHQFAFSVQSRDSNFIVADPKVFHQMLHGFEYTGLTLSCAEQSTTLTSPTAAVTLTPAPSLPPTQILSAVEALPGFENPVQVASLLRTVPTVTIHLSWSFRDGGATEYSDGYYSLPHYIIRASVNDVRMVTYDVTYNPTTRAFSLIRLVQWQPSDPGYGKPFPWVGISSSAAWQALCSANGLALAA